MPSWGDERHARDERGAVRVSASCLEAQRCKPMCLQSIVGTWHYNTNLCELCPANFSCSGDDTPAQQCPSSSVAAPGSAAQTDCICAPGYSGPAGGPCRACRAGQWKAANGSAPCSECAANSSSAEGIIVQTACMCDAGHTGPDGGPCRACQVGKYKPYKPLAGASTSRTSRWQELLPAGTAPLAQQHARAPPKHTSTVCARAARSLPASMLPATQASSSLALWASTGKHPPCHKCARHARHTRLQTAVGARNISDCVCLPGRYRNEQDSSGCQPYPANTFKASVGNSVCTAYVSAPTGSNVSSACQCTPGFTGVNGGACAACSQGEYKAALGSSACSKCAANSLSPVASVAATACVDGSVPQEARALHVRATHTRSLGRVWTEDDWSRAEGCEAYAKWKTLTEQAAWKFIKEEQPVGRNLEMPSSIPPLLSDTLSLKVHTVLCIVAFLFLHTVLCIVALYIYLYMYLIYLHVHMY